MPRSFVCATSCAVAAAWAPFIRVEKFHGKRNARAVADVMQRGGVLLSTYGTCTANPGVLGAMSGRSAGSSAADDNESAPSEQQWESALAPGHWMPGNDATVSWSVSYCVLHRPTFDHVLKSHAGDTLSYADEGHKMKNPADLASAQGNGKRIPAKYRLLLSGTPIQNSKQPKSWMGASNEAGSDVFPSQTLNDVVVLSLTTPTWEARSWHAR